MGTPLSNIRAAALASAIFCAGIGPAAAAPTFVPNTLNVQSDVVQVMDSARIIRRDKSHRDGDRHKRRHHRDGHEHARDHHDGDGDGHKRRHRRDGREHARDHHDGDGDGHKRFRPKATSKNAYDAYSNYRVFDGSGWDDKDRWDGKKRKKRPRIYKGTSFGIKEPSPALKGILTAVPD